ncbi:MAG: glutathione S-transferase [Micavibrio sp.]|nr:glutathione S-transferase [Micavibrio sp.]|tara:strand:- start:5063 stop:5716 length:654 start_codon:yes stop_codon:yes gene_type:complete
MTNQEPQNTLPVLYSFRRCPYAMRARLALYYAGIKLELREIVLRDKPASMIKASPKGTVPVLITAKGHVIDESLDIMHHALAENDPDGWLPHHNKGLIDTNDHIFKKALDRYKYPGRYPDEDCSGARGQCEDFFKTLNQHLTGNRYLSAPHITLTDMAIFPFIRQCANVDRGWFDALPYPALQQWLDTHLNSDIFAAIMTKYPPWAEGDLPLIWPQE